MRRISLITTLAGLTIAIVFTITVLVGQQPVEVRRITAPATGTQVAASSDSVVCSTDLGCVVKQATGSNLNANVTLQTQTDTVMIGGVNVKEINAVTPLMGNGVTGTGSQRVTVASDNTAFPVNAQPFAATSGGATSCYITSAANNNSTNCKGSAGQIYHISAHNTTTTNYFLKLYNLASAPTCSSATGFVRSAVVFGASSNGGGFEQDIGIGEAYSTGIGFCLVATDGSSTQNTSAATGVYLNIDFK